jgi:hypothetical protein
MDDARYAAGATQPYAMPLAVQPSGAGRWHAMVNPLADPFTLYLKIFRDADGSLKAAFRNPEQNSHGPAMQLGLTRTGDTLRFAAGADSAPPNEPLAATLKRNPERIEISWSDVKRTIAVTRYPGVQPLPRGVKCARLRVATARDPGWLEDGAASRHRRSAADARRAKVSMSILPARARHLLVAITIAMPCAR